MNMKQQSNLICKLLLLLLMLAGTSSAWAVDYIYNIINNSGNLVMRVKSTKTSVSARPCTHAFCAKLPVLQNLGRGSE